MTSLPWRYGIVGHSSCGRYEAAPGETKASCRSRRGLSKRTAWSALRDALYGKLPYAFNPKPEVPSPEEPCLLSRRLTLSCAQPDPRNHVPVVLRFQTLIDTDSLSNRRLPRRDGLNRPETLASIVCGK